MRDRDLTLTDADLLLVEEERCVQERDTNRLLPRHMCTHSQWSWERWGRVCPSCLTFVVDLGD